MAAQGAELQLKVGLDLTFFRQQLSGLGAAAARYNLPINIKFDRRGIQNELNALGRNISQKTYRLEVATNISAEIKNAGTLAKALRGLNNAIEKNKGVANRAVAGSVTGNIDASKVQALINRATKPALQALYQEMSRANIPMAAVGKETVTSLKASILSGVPQLTTDLAKGIANGLDPQMKESGSKGAKLFINAWKDAAGIASPSKVFKTLGEFSADGLEIGFINGLKDFKAKAILEVRNLVQSLQREARVGMITVGGMLSPAGVPRGAATRTVPGMTLPRNISTQQDEGRSYRKILNSLSLLTGDPKLYRARMASLGPGQLPSSLLGSAATQMNLETIAPSFRQSRLSGTKTGVANVIDEAFFGRASLPKASGALNDFNNALERIAKSARAAMPSGILQSASGAPRFRQFGGVSPTQGMGIFAPTARQAAYPSSGGFLQFSRRATAISAGLAGNVFGGRNVPTSPGMTTGGGASPPTPPSIVPPMPPVPPSGPGGRSGGFGGGGGGSFARAMGNVRLPGTGVIRELAGEFGEATKQVLLFGTAYKALAFATSFPAQVGQAVGALQSFNNTLKSISPTANEARASNELILSLVERYNIPLQSARDGFTKLYASMQPAGFSGEEVRNMFVGISKAAAAFGMSADKVDRVNYAFAQMASKGQVMSEELKGQLGDVLPGAMAIFAEAAGFKGPDAIQKFSAALEAGAYKGNAMKVLLMNVGTIMNKEFGPGAEGAARTFQGAINRMQNSLTLLYETFEPVALGFLNAVVVPMTNGIKEISDGFNAFFKDTAAKTSGGFAIAQELEQLKPAFDGIKANVAGVIEQLGQFAKIALEVGKVLLQIAGNPFVGYLARVYINVLALTTAIQVLNLRALIPMIANLARSAYALIAFTMQCARAGQASQVMGLMARTAGLTLRTFFATTGVGLVLVGISALIEHFMSMNQKLDETRQKALGAADAIRQMSGTEARAAGQQAQTAYSLIGSIAGRQSPAFSGTGGGKGDRLVPITAKEFEQLSKLGAIQTQQGAGGLLARRSDILSLAPQAQRLKSEAEFRQSQLRFEERQAQSPATLAAVPEAPPSGKDAEAAAARAAKTAEQLAQEKYKYEADLIRRNGDQVIALNNLEFDHWKTLQEQKYSLAEAGQNEWMQREIKFQRDLQAIEIERIETIRRAQQEAQKATVRAQAAAVEAQAGPMGTAAFASGGRGGGSANPARGTMFQGFEVTSVPGESRAYRNGTHEGYDFATPIGTAISYTIGGIVKSIDKVGRSNAGKTIEVMLDNGLMGMSMHLNEVLLEAGQRFEANQIIARTGDTGAGPAHYHHESAPHAYRSGGAGASLPYLQLGGARAAAGSSSSQVRMERNANDVRLATLDAAQAKEQEILLTKYAQEVAQGKNNLLIKEYVASLVPVEQQKLENALLVERNRLLSTGLSGNILEAEMTMFEATERLNLARKEANVIIENNNKLLKDGAIAADEAARRNAIQTARINELADATAKHLPLLKEKTVLEMQGEFNRSRQALDQRAQILSMPLGMERLGELRQQFPGRNDYAQQLYEIENRLNAIENLRNSLKDVAGGIGQAFGQATKDVLTSSNSIQQTLANLFQSIADSFASMVASMIAEWVKAQVIKGFQSIFNLVPGGAAPSIPIPGSTLELAANGAVWQGGFTAFANGGMVTGPTLGLVGEGRYNEAIVPLPDGKSIPVELGGNAGGSTSVIVNVDAKGTSAQGNESAAKELGIVISAAVQQELVKQRRPGGILSK